jgi:ribosomal protein S18 acetylase RimI-like enzyme
VIARAVVHPSLSLLRISNNMSSETRSNTTSTLSYTIRQLTGEEVVTNAAGLGEILFDIVQACHCVGFLNTLTLEEATQYWVEFAKRVEKGEIITLGCFAGPQTVTINGSNDGNRVIVGTVSLEIKLPQNQPHRANIVKLQVHTQHRGKGLAKKLMLEIEHVAKHTCNRSLVLLNTKASSDAAKMYATMGYVKYGEIPGYAMFPDGSMDIDAFFYKNL